MRDAYAHVHEITVECRDLMVIQYLVGCTFCL